MSLLPLFLSFFLTSVSGAILQYERTVLSDQQPNVTLTVGTTNQRVYCVQATGPLPTSIEWYNPQGQLVSRNNKEEVNQAGSSRAAILTFRSYQQSQGGKYECRVTGPGNNTERLSVCIGECYTFVLTVGLRLQLAIVEFFLYQVYTYTTCTAYTPYNLAQVVAILSCVVVVNLTKLEQMVGWLHEARWWLYMVVLMLCMLYNHCVGLLLALLYIRTLYNCMLVHS